MTALVPPAISLHDQFESTQRRPSGFDYLRIGLAVVIILFHAPIVCSGPSMIAWLLGGPLRPITFFLVPSFFALSGFLIAGSLERNPLPTFFVLRALRIVPALAAEVFISGVVIGAIFTTLPLKEYFTSLGFWQYFENIVGLVHFRLPGVFLDLPMPDNVNGQLWTIPFELDCYLMLGVLALVGIVQRPRLLFAFACAIVLAITFWPLVDGLPHPRNNAAPGRMLITVTLFGVWLYKARRSIPFSWPLFWATLAITVLMLETTDLIYVATLPLAYVTVFLGLLNPPRISLLKSGDYSYALYLYSLPIQQSIVALFPWGREWILNFAFAISLSAVCAYVSWHYLEAPVLAARKFIVPPIERLSRRLGQGLAASIATMRSPSAKTKAATER